MRIPFLFMTIIGFLYSCSTSTDQEGSNTARETYESDSIHLEPKPDSVEDSDIDRSETVYEVEEMALWADPYIKKYLDANSDRLMEVDTFPISYIKETTIENGRNYAMVRIGHSFEHRYVTDQWIYIDSLTHDIYEYDLINDTLLLWTE